MLALGTLSGAGIPARADDLNPLALQVATTLLSESERRIIGDYFQRHYAVWAAATNSGKGKHTGLPPGLARKGVLSPGLAEQLVRNNHLPPGLTKIYLPDDLLAQLPPLQAGHELILVDDRVLLLQTATSLILDVVVVAAADAS
ncbi:MAG: hypothetical protein ACREE7_02390 [Dongiaceae bacterium]